MSPRAGYFSVRIAHPEARRAEGSPDEILPRFARQDEESNTGNNSPTPHFKLAFNEEERKSNYCTCYR